VLRGLLTYLVSMNPPEAIHAGGAWFAERSGSRHLADRLSSPVGPHTADTSRQPCPPRYYLFPVNSRDLL
jgi:hypothetical protein